jgi:hypothetical protein
MLRSARKAAFVLGSLALGLVACSGAGGTTPEASLSGEPSASIDSVNLNTARLEAPAELSEQQCYFTSNPPGSYKCVTAPCKVVNWSTATKLCELCVLGMQNNMLPERGIESEYYQVGGNLYETYPPWWMPPDMNILPPNPAQDGQIISLYRGDYEQVFPACHGGAVLQNDSTSEDYYYGTGLVVGQTTASELASTCIGPIGTFP